MRNADNIGYSQWKENLFRDKDKDIDDLACVGALLDSLERKVESPFAIKINQVFENNFAAAVEKMKAHMFENYGGTSHLERHLEESKKEEEDLYTEVKPVKKFIDWINEGLAISVKLIADEPESTSSAQLVLTFPTEESKEIFEALLGGRKNITQGVFSGRDCPSYVKTNSRALKFPVHIADGKMCVVFPEQKIAIRFFNKLPELTSKLGANSYLNPHVPITHNFTQVPGFTILTPEFLFGYERVLLVTDFPEKTNPGTLYVRVSKKLDKVSIKSTSVFRDLDHYECDRLLKSLGVDGILINFKQLKHAPLDVSQGTNTFTTVTSMCGSSSALTLKKGTKPYVGIFGENRIPTGQPLLIDEFKRAVIGAKLEESTEKVKATEDLYCQESQTEAKLNVQVETALQDKREAEAEYKTAQEAVEKAKNEQRSKGRAVSMANLEIRVKSIFSKPNKADQNKAAEEYKIATANLDKAEEQLLNVKTRLALTTSRLDDVSKRKIKQSEVTGALLSQLMVAQQTNKSVAKVKSGLKVQVPPSSPPSKFMHG